MIMVEYDYDNSAKQKKKDLQDEIILADIEKINSAIESDKEDDLRALHISLDGKYSSYIARWGMSTYGYNERFGFHYESIGKKSLIHNLSVFKARLEGFALDKGADVAITIMGLIFQMKLGM